MQSLTKITITLAFALACTLPAQAAQWLAEPVISLRAGYNDNIRLNNEDQDTVFEMALSPSVRFGVMENNSGVFGDIGFSIQRFKGGSGEDSSDELDRENYHLNTSAYYDTVLNSFSGSLNFTRDSTLDSFLDETGTVDSSRATTLRTSATPSWTRTLNEKTFLSMNASYSTIKFEDELPGASNVESDSYSLNTSLNRTLTPLMSATLSTTYSTYRPDTGFNSDTINIQVGLSRSFSETLSGSFLAGRRETTSDTLRLTGICLFSPPEFVFPNCGPGIRFPRGTVDDEIKNRGSVYSVNLDKSFDAGSVSATLSRSTSPSTDGQLLDSTRLVFSGRYQHSTRLSTSLSISFSEQETIANIIGREPDTDADQFFSLQPRISWRLSPEWDISANYEYAKSKPADSDTATRNAISVSLGYHPTRFFISR